MAARNNSAKHHYSFRFLPWYFAACYIIRRIWNVALRRRANLVHFLLGLVFLYVPNARRNGRKASTTHRQLLTTWTDLWPRMWCDDCRHLNPDLHENLTSRRQFDRNLPTRRKLLCLSLSNFGGVLRWHDDNAAFQPSVRRISSDHRSRNRDWMYRR